MSSDELETVVSELEKFLEERTDSPAADDVLHILTQLRRRGQ